MPDSKNEPTRFELYQAGKIEGRRSFRPPVVPDVAAKKDDVDDGSISFSPTVIVIALLVAVLLVLTAIAL
jgi:hypothetical protein